MAKKKASGIKMAEEIRSVLGEHPGYALKEAREAIEAGHPGVKINDNSFSVAFYAARKKLGIGSSWNGRGGKRVVRKKVPSAVRPHVDLGTLQAAAKFLMDVGDSEKALEAVRQVKALQLR